MALDDVVHCAAGLRIVRDGRARSGDRVLRVEGPRPVALPPEPPVESRRADAMVWRRHWIEPDRMVIEFVDLAWVEVRDVTSTVAFDRPLPPDMEEHLLLDHVLPLVLARDGHTVLHGGLMSLDGTGAVVIGASGAGKSTMIAFAWQQGWTVGGDDGTVVVPSSPPRAEPTYSTIRLSAASIELLGIDPSSTVPVAGKLRIDDPTRPFAPDAVAVRVVASVVRAPAGAAASFERLDGMDAHALLFGSTFHAELSGGRRLTTTVDHLARIIETADVGRLTIPGGRRGLAAAERVLRDALASSLSRPVAR